MDIFLQNILNDPVVNNKTLAHFTSIHIAVIMKRGKIICTAANKIGGRTNGSGWSDNTLHAEKAVVKELGDLNILRDSTLYVIRISRAKSKVGFDRIMSSEPCHDCRLFLEKCRSKYGLRRVFYYGNDDEFVEMSCCSSQHLLGKAGQK